jgi:2'-5' RNA ligase superfamily
VPEAEPFAVGDGALPTHLTLAGPWPLETPLPLRQLEGLRASIDGERYALDRVGTLGDAVCLFPDPDSERMLMGRREKVLDLVGARDGVDTSWRLHVTIGRGLRARPEIEASVLPLLPLRCEIDGLLLARRDANARVTSRAL